MVLLYVFRLYKIINDTYCHGDDTISTKVTIVTMVDDQSSQPCVSYDGDDSFLFLLLSFFLGTDHSVTETSPPKVG